MDRYRLAIQWPKPYAIARHMCGDKQDAMKAGERVKQLGLNGERRVFPVRVWIEECNKFGM